MNNNLRKKLGLSTKDYVSDIKKSEQKVANSTPISLDKSIKDYAYSQLNIKTINVGTLRKPIEKLVVFNDETKSYNIVELAKVTDVGNTYYYSRQNSLIYLNGEVANYYTNLKIDENNPYDPLFASFNRLPSRASNIYVQSGVTGLFLGERERFFALTSGFSKSTNIEIQGAGRNLNGVFLQTSQIINGKPRYLNTSLAFPADILWTNNPSGWLLRQSARLNNTGPLGYRSYYFSSSTGNAPTGAWSITGFGSFTGTFPLPTSNQLDLEGFFKIATTRISSNKNRIYATGLGETGVLAGSTTGNLPIGASWVTYPHSYNIQRFPAFRYNTVLTFDENKKVSDLIIVSTGIGDKKIIYVSPHKVENFAGFWAETSISSRTPLSGVGGRTVNRLVYSLHSGNLLSVSSNDYNFTALSSSKVFVSGISGFKEFYNLNEAMLKQTTPLSQTPFYKLYEPIYLKNGVATGTWNGIIPSGVPFAIETIRTKNAEIISPLISVHIINSFVNNTPNGSGSFNYVRPHNAGEFMGFGSFNGRKTTFSLNSTYEANYIAETKAKKQSKAKLHGYLWEVGFLKGNNKVNKMVKLLTPRNQETPRRCKTYINPSDPTSCSYTGVNKGIIGGVLTSAGIRLPDHTLIPNKTINGEKILWQSF